MNTERNRGWYWVCHLQTINMNRLNQLISFINDPQELMGLSDRELEAAGCLSEKERKLFALHRDNQEMILESYEQLNEQGIQFVSLEDKEYPKRLNELSDRPVGLFVRGRMPDNAMPCVSIVGARACSTYGRDCAAYFGRSLARAGIQVVSGMASGIDSEAQQAALQEKGRSFSVLGGGTDICYPKESYALYSSLIRNGGVMSEMLPGTQSRPFLFVRRNRIISGIADAVIVVEAREKSGSLITASYAAEQGRLVYAVPGRIDSSLSRGCHELIRNGAILLQDPGELLEDLKMTLEAEQMKEFSEGNVRITAREKDVYNWLEKEPVHIEWLLSKTGYPAGDLMYVLLQLEIKGYICQNPQNYYRKSRLLPPETCADS